MTSHHPPACPTCRAALEEEECQRVRLAYPEGGWEGLREWIPRGGGAPPDRMRGVTVVDELSDIYDADIRRAMNGDHEL